MMQVSARVFHYPGAADGCLFVDIYDADDLSADRFCVLVCFWEYLWDWICTKMTWVFASEALVVELSNLLPVVCIARDDR